MSKISLQSKIYFKTVRSLDFIDDPRYDDRNGKTLAELNRDYRMPYIDTDFNKERVVYHSCFNIIRNEKEQYMLLFDITYNDKENNFRALAVKIGEETAEDGTAKTYCLSWEITNKQAEKANGKFNWQDFKAVETDYGRIVVTG